jgi:hypothetical protein
MFARDSLKSVPSIRIWWDDETRRVVVNLKAREMRQKLGLK